MFSALNQGSSIYILDKTEGIKYKVGEIVGITSPNGFNNTYSPNFSSNIDIKVKVDGDVIDYPGVLSSSNKFSFNNGTVIISETKEGLQNEVNTIISQRKLILENIPKYELDIRDCEEINKVINPQYAKDKERDDRLNSLESRFGGVEDKLDKIINLINK